LKIGVFGLGIELKGLVWDTSYGNTKYLNPVEVAREMVQELTRKECDLIICLSHLGYKYPDAKISDVELAKQVSGIDLIIGGHTHTFLDEPVPIINPDGNQTLITQVGWAGIKLGRLDYVFSKGKKKKVSKSSSLFIK
jgi:5'-nucleotidase